MKLTRSEIEFLAAWAREEWQPQCYQLPAHRLQLAHGVSGALLIDFIKAWTRTEAKKDQDIQHEAAYPARRAGGIISISLPWRSRDCPWDETCESDRRHRQRTICQWRLESMTPYSR